MSFTGNVVASATGVLRIDASQVEQGVNQAGLALGNLNNISRQSYFGLQNLGLGFEAVGAAALGVVTASVAAATSWESGNARIEASAFGSEAAVKASSGAINQFKLQLEGIADSTPVPLKAIQSVGDEVAKLGVGIQSVAPVTKEVIDLNQLTGTSYDTLTQGIGKATISLGLGSAGIKSFGSTLFDLQRLTAATPEDILTLTNRIAGIGPAARISEPDVLGIAASVASVGGNARTNASAIQKFIEDIVTAMQSGGASAEAFARLAGQSAQQFAQSWAKDPGDALGAVLTGLGNLNQVQGQGQAILQSLGLTQATQIDSLLKIAQAQTNAASGATSIVNANQAANQSWRDGNSVQNASALIYGTTSARLEELKNQVQLTAVNFGAVFLPELRAVSGFMTNVAAGFEALPGPIQAVVGGTTILVGATAAFAGGLLLLLPRVLLARQALEQLLPSLRAKTAATQEDTVVTEASAEATGFAAEASANTVDPHYEEAASAEAAAEGETLLTAAARMTAEALINFAGTAGVVVAAEEEVAVASEEAGTAINLAFAGIPAVLGVIALAVVGLGQLGAAHRQAATDALNDGQANSSLLSVLQQEATGAKGAADAWILHDLASKGVLTTLEAMGVPINHVLDLIKGNASPTFLDAFEQRLKVLAAAHPELAKTVTDALGGMITEYKVTAEASNSLTKAQQQEAGASGDQGNAADLAANKIETLAQKEQKAAAAAKDYGQAVISNLQATNALGDARQKLAEASDDLANKDLLLQDAENKVADAQINGQKAAVDLADAQFVVDNAREEQSLALQTATEGLSGAELSHRQAIQGVKDAQEALNKAMDPTESVNKQRDALNQLRDAQQSLHDSQQNVEDAQWQINYLMGEGASSRDIRDARDVLANAQNKAADAAAKVTDAQDKLNKAQDVTDIANKQADAQLALEQAELQVTTSSTNLEQAQLNLNQAQLDASNNKALIDAQAALQQAHDQITASQIQEYKATEDLHAIQNGSLERAFAAAQNGVESAIYQVATSAVQVKKDLAEMRGETYTDAQYASDLRTQLTDLGNQVGGPISAQIGAIAGQIRGAGGAMSGLGGAVGGVNNQLALIGPNGAAAQAGLEAATPTVHHTSWWHALSTEIGNAAKSVGDFFGNIVTGILHVPQNLASKVVDFFAHPFAEGGLITAPTLALVGESGPEVVLPLNNPARMQEILSQAASLGLTSSPQSYTAAPLSAVAQTAVAQPAQGPSYQYGDFAPTIISNADPDDMMREWDWRHRVKSRSA